MNVDTVYLVIAAVIFGGVGVLIGGFIAKKTKILDNFSQESREFNKIMKDPEVLIKKIQESALKLNPEAKGDLVIKDNKDIITLGTKEVNGKKVLDITREKDHMSIEEEKRIKERFNKKKQKAQKENLNKQKQL